MDELEALLARDYILNGRRSLPRARAAFRHLRSLEGVSPERAYTATLAYAEERISTGAASATVRYQVAIYGRALTLARRAGFIRVHPDLARPKVQNARRGFVSRSDFMTLLRHLSQPIRDAALFAYVTGWRRQELFDLTWDRVEEDTWSIRLEPGSTKNLQGRTYPAGAHPLLRAMFERRHRERVGPFVFHRNGQKVLHFLRSWNTACRRAGLGHTLFHDLRRSAVRNMERAGVPRSVAMQLTGHKTESIYRRYAITNEKDLARGVSLLASLSSEERRRSSSSANAKQEGVSEAPKRDRFERRPRVEP